MSSPTLKRQAPPAAPAKHLAAIFVHAGAGYHSTQNEHVHLQACADAAKMAMAALKSGGSALDAVEFAIMSLEDNEVTNAGYGSNLTQEGLVEGDATIVDHLGRSGAVGAIGKVPNPIQVARQVYERSTKPMPLRRVPPNLLVGIGATDFAQEHSLRVVANEKLVSYGARDRFKKWQQDIQVAEGGQSPQTNRDSPSSDEFEHDLNEEEQQTIKNYGPAASTNPIIAALANESQPFSPAEDRDDINELFPTTAAGSSVGPSKLRRRSNSRTSAANGHADSFFDDYDANPALFAPSTASLTAMEGAQTGHAFPYDDDLLDIDLTAESISFSFESPGPGNSDTSLFGLPPSLYEPPRKKTESPRGDTTTHTEDMISDTVGAIAIDEDGNIAAASSSGGIGMKHRGRVGPAALVGIGTAVIPISPQDKERCTVACVTSGTGEHMATSMAAATCAQRVYYSAKVDSKGSAAACDEEEAMQSFIKRDFMGHPSVKNSTTGGAIGTMAVKKDSDGLWLYFAHNTNSFALASMHSNDAEPHTVMSRSAKQGKVVSGGRAMRPPPVQTRSSPLPKTPRAKRVKQNRPNNGDSAAG